MSNYTFAQIQNLWVQAGGSPTASRMAAAIALAESGGDPNAKNSNNNGTTDRGLWQINSVHGSQSTFDPLANAKAAVAISQNGTTWRPWCTAWSNGLCGGTYLGTGAPVFKFLSGGVGTSPVVGVPTATTATETSASLLDPQSWADAFLKPIGLWFFYGAMGFLGALMMSWGVWAMIFHTQTFKTVLNLGASAATRGAVTNVSAKSAVDANNRRLNKRDAERKEQAKTAQREYQRQQKAAEKKAAKESSKS